VTTNPKAVAVEVKAMRDYVEKTVRDAVVTINDQDGSWTMKWSTGEKSGKGFMQLVNTYDFLKKVKNSGMNKTMKSALCQRQEQKTAGKWKVLLRNTRGGQREQEVAGVDYNSAERAARKFMKDGEQVVSVTIASKMAEAAPAPFQVTAMDALFQEEFKKLADARHPEIGDVYQLPRFGEAILTNIDYPRRGSNTTFTFWPVKGLEKGGYVYMKAPTLDPTRVKWLRKGKPAEVAKAKQTVTENIVKRQENEHNRYKENTSKLEDVGPGDVVEFKWSDTGPRNEVVEDINWAKGRVALRRRGAGALYNERKRYVDARGIVKLVEKGPGHYDPKNPIYQKYGFEPEDPSAGTYGEKSFRKQRRDFMNQPWDVIAPKKPEKPWAAGPEVDENFDKNSADDDISRQEYEKMRGQPRPEIPGSNEIQELERRQRGRRDEIDKKYPVKPILPIRDPFKS